MDQDIQRIGVGNIRFPSITDSSVDPDSGIFTFDSTTVSFDNIAHTFDEEIEIIPIVIAGDYSKIDYSSIDYLTSK